MKRYIVKSGDKAAKKRKDYFVELGLYDFWELAMREIEIKIPPVVEITDIEQAFNILQNFIGECGNTINIDFPEECNTDSISGVEIENETMRLINGTIDEAGHRLDEFEEQYGFTFDRLVLNTAHILIYSKIREVPEEIETDKELLKRQQSLYNLTIYEHRWGNFEHTPILQYVTRYYCDAGLVAVLSPKASLRVYEPEDFF